jgi:hypothetical protein
LPTVVLSIVYMYGCFRIWENRSRGSTRINITNDATYKERNLSAGPWLAAFLHAGKVVGIHPTIVQRSRFQPTFVEHHNEFVLLLRIELPAESLRELCCGVVWHQVLLRWDAYCGSSSSSSWNERHTPASVYRLVSQPSMMFGDETLSPSTIATEVLLSSKIAASGLREERRMSRQAVFGGTGSTSNSLALRRRGRGRG